MDNGCKVIDFKTKKEILREKSAQIIERSEDPKKAVEDLENMLCKEAVYLGATIARTFIQKIISWAESKSVNESKKVVDLYD